MLNRSPASNRPRSLGATRDNNAGFFKLSILRLLKPLKISEDSTIVLAIGDLGEEKFAIDCDMAWELANMSARDFENSRSLSIAGVVEVDPPKLKLKWPLVRVGTTGSTPAADAVVGFDDGLLVEGVDGDDIGLGSNLTVFLVAEEALLRRNGDDEEEEEEENEDEEDKPPFVSNSLSD